jgi:hypothetical protein
MLASWATDSFSMELIKHTTLVVYYGSISLGFSQSVAERDWIKN